MKPVLVNKQEDLLNVVSKAASASEIAFDTEFFRRDTYYAKLALFQVTFGEQIYVIDTIDVDIKDFWYAIASSRAVKIIHSGRQDLEIMFYLFGKLPNNIFDTQIAASFCNLGSDIGYANLCGAICNIEEMDKGLQSSNWLRRPITNEMIEYASIDVKYLIQIYKHLNEFIVSQNREYLFQEKIFDNLLDQNLYTKVSEHAWKKIRYYKKDEKFLERLKVVCKFREEMAQKLDVPRKFLFTDDQLIQICNHPPISSEFFEKMKGLSDYAKLQLCKDGLLSITRSWN